MSAVTDLIGKIATLVTWQPTVTGWGDAFLGFLNSLSSTVNDLYQVIISKAAGDHTHEGDTPILSRGGEADRLPDGHTVHLREDTGATERVVDGTRTATLASEGDTVYARQMAASVEVDWSQPADLVDAGDEGYGDYGISLPASRTSGVVLRAIAPVSGRALRLVLAHKPTSAAQEAMRLELAYFVRRNLGPSDVVMARRAPLTAYAQGDRRVPDASNGYQYICTVAGTSAGKALTFSDLGQQAGQLWINCMVDLGGGLLLVGTGTSGKILRSATYGASFSDLGTKFSQTHIYALAYLGTGIVLAGTSPGGLLLRSEDYGLTWTSQGQLLAGQTAVMLLNYLGNGVVLAGVGSHILRSTDYGATWSDLGQQFSQAEVKSICSVGGGICLAGTSSGGLILRSTDYGATWSSLGQQFSQGSVDSVVSLGGGICLAGTSSGGLVLRSTDYGATWSSLGQQFSQTRVNGLTNLGEGVVLAGTAPGYHVIRSADYGATWSDLGAVSGANYITSIAWLGGGRVLVGTGNGHIWGSNPIWPSTVGQTVVDGTVTWQCQAAGLKPLQGWSVYPPGAEALAVGELTVTVPADEIVAQYDSVVVSLRRAPRAGGHPGDLILTDAWQQAVEAA